MRTVVIALFCFGASSLAVAEEPAACPPDMQRFEAVCLSNRMIAYLKCLEKINGGRLHIAKDEADAKPSSVTVEIEGEGHAAIAKGSGKVKIDSRNDQTSIRKLDETISPDVVTGCIELAGVARAPAAKRKRSTARKGADEPDKKPPAGAHAKPVIPPGKYVPPNQSQLEKECGAGALEACARLAGIISDDKRIADLAGQACAGGVALGCTALADFNSTHYPTVENGGQYPQVVKAWMADKVLPYYKKACAADEPGGCAGYAVTAARYELASGTEDLDGVRAKATALWEKSCAKGHLDDCDLLAESDRLSRGKSRLRHLHGPLRGGTHQILPTGRELLRDRPAGEARGHREGQSPLSEGMPRGRRRRLRLAQRSAGGAPKAARLQSSVNAFRVFAQNVS